MRKTMKILVVFIVILSLLNVAFCPLQKKEVDLVLDTRTRVAYRAAFLAVESMPGIYSWEEYRSCSSFASAYLRQLSYPVDGMEGQYSEHEDPFPWSGVVKQVSWIRRNAPTMIHDAPLADFLNGKLWGEIKPGSLIYLQTAVGHNGFNTYYHVVVLVGYHTDGSPQFAEITPGISASFDRSFSQVISFYQKYANGDWSVKPYDTKENTPKELVVTWFDSIGYMENNLWLVPGRVVPNSQFVEDKFSVLVTVNIYDGTTVIYEKDETTSLGWKVVNLGGKEEFYAVVGRLLPVNSNIGKVFFGSHEREIYDNDYGIYLSENGVFQHTWTPQMIARVDSFEYVSGFGGLNGATETSILTPLSYVDGVIKDGSDYSPFTIHKIPDVVNQDMLLRVDLLKEANNKSGCCYGPISVPKVNLSSGCVNYDPETWTLMKTYLQSRLKDGVGVIFSYPEYDQDLIMGFDIFKSPFLGRLFFKWCPEFGDNACDYLDRRSY